MRERFPSNCTYTQRLAALELAIERNTSNVPPDGYYHLLHAGKEIDRYRSMRAAKAAWDEIVAASGWSSDRRTRLTSEEMLARDRAARERQEKAEHWHRVRGRR